MTYAVRHRVVLLFTYTCLVGMLIAPVHAQVRGRGADPGTKTPEPSAAPRQEAITVNAKSAVLMEGASGQILAAQNKDEKIAPASFAKVLTLYVVYDMIRSGKIHLTDEVYISKKAWETGWVKNVCRTWVRKFLLRRSLKALPLFQGMTRVLPLLSISLAVLKCLSS